MVKGGFSYSMEIRSDAIAAPAKEDVKEKDQAKGEGTEPQGMLDNEAAPKNELTKKDAKPAKTVAMAKTAKTPAPKAKAAVKSAATPAPASAAKKSGKNLMD